ncbi:unnamed protein product [Cylicocyclus nassatus]|uniref:ABC transporter domain-containing protein n=1 Tax=Cylicocyclus nassatus TaxID=53992 RepID=A0AA36GRL5_CYLNA|nr:unnamed protein product [Cylicocyclus nassatus]
MEPTWGDWRKENELLKKQSTHLSVIGLSCAISAHRSFCHDFAMALREREGQRLQHPDIFTQKTDYDLSAYYNQALARKEQLSHSDGDDMPTNSIILALPKAFERVRTEVAAEDSVKFVVYNHLDDMADQLNKIPISAAMLWVWPEKMPRSDQMRRSMQAVERHLQCGGTLDCFPPPFEKMRRDEWEELRKVCIEVVRMLTGPARGLITLTFIMTKLIFVYVISLIINGNEKAMCFLLFYELAGIIGTAHLLGKFNIKAGNFGVWMSPSYALSQGVLLQGKIDKRNILSFFVHGSIFLLILYMYEYQLDKLTKIFCRKTYVEKSNIPDSEDVIQEREHVQNNASLFTLTVQNLTKYYGSNCALKGVTFGVRNEDCFGLIGPSGAGKTSAFAIITGSRFANNGSVHIGEQYVNRTQGIGYCPQFDAALPHLSCKQNMVIIAGIIGYKEPSSIVEQMLRFLDLEKHAKKAFSNCSGGQRRRVNIGIALLNPSKLVILDEPTAGIDPKTRRHIWKLLKQMRSKGRALVLSSHSMEECEALCSRLGVLVKGRFVAIGASQTLKSKYANNYFLLTILKSLEDRKKVINAVLSTFPSSELVTKQEDTLNLKFKIPRREGDKLSELYEKAQTMATSLSLSDFSLLQGSLEDVFEFLNKKYGEENLDV